MALVDVLIPTYRRKTGLAVVLTSLLGQTFTDFSVNISDQTAEHETYLDGIEIQTLIQALRWHGHNVTLHRHLPRRGMAEQRQFLLECSARPSSGGCPAPYVNYLDDVEQVVRYKVAWIGGANVLYDRAKLLSVGGFSWWHRLPPEHAGEEVVVQFLLLRKYGGCGILPSGTYHLGLPTTVEDRRHNATTLFGELIQEIEAGKI